MQPETKPMSTFSLSRLISTSRRFYRSLLAILAFAIMFVLAGVQPPVSAASPRHYTDLTFPPLAEIEIPTYDRFQLVNGLTVYLMEDHELPLVKASALIKTGARLEPPEQVGLANITGSVIRSGGTQQHTSDLLNELLEQRAAAIETEIGTTAGSASFDCLSQDLPDILALFSEVLQTPAFEPSKIALAKTQAQGNIARRNDNPNSIARREFSKLIYGPDSAYARTIEYTTLARIDRPSIQQFYQQSVRPENIILGVVGDFDTPTLKDLIIRQFGTWQPAQPASSLPQPPSASQAEQGGIFFVEQPQLTQSYIQIGHLGGQLNSPDYPALDVMNNVLNGFGGRLFNELRSRKGLAYSVYAAWSARYDYPGIFIAGGQTRSEATVPFIESLKTEIKRIRQTRISQDELNYAKESTLNSFVFNFQSPDEILSRLLRYEYYGYPTDFLQRYRQAVEATTIVDVERVARQYLQPENLVTLVVGNQAEIQPDLSSLNGGTQVTQIDITIPEPS